MSLYFIKKSTIVYVFSMVSSCVWSTPVSTFLLLSFFALKKVDLTTSVFNCLRAVMVDFQSLWDWFFYISRHFPKKIPEKGENIIFYCSKDSYFGGKIIFVMFDTNNSYIKSELKKYRYITSDNKTKSIARSFVFDELLKRHIVNINDYKFYVIGNNSNTRNCHHSCEYGIAVNEKTNTIIYYVSNPD